MLTYSFPETGPAILSSGTLYVKKDRILPKIEEYLKELNIKIANYNEVGKDFEALKDEKIYINKSYCNSFIYRCLKDNELVDDSNPIVEHLKVSLKFSLLYYRICQAIKNSRESKGFIDCHIRDGVAVVFL